MVMTSLPYICSIFLSGSRGIFTNVLLADKIILVVLLSFSSSLGTAAHNDWKDVPYSKHSCEKEGKSAKRHLSPNLRANCLAV